MNFNDKKIFILGMARSGYECAKALSKYTNDILVTDGKEQDKEHVEELKQLGIKVVITNKQDELLDETFDYVIKNPGIKIDSPIELKAKALNIPVINEVEVAYHLLPKGVKIVGITGSNGKTTTTSLTYEILKKANLPVHLGGNIGIPLCAIIKDVKENDILVLEISGHQLHDMKDFKTDISVMTNLTEVHTDHFGTYENYKYNKTKIFKNHTISDIAIINGNNEDVAEMTRDIKSKKITFSANNNSNLFIKDDQIFYDKQAIIKLEDIRLKGNHNYENIMCAIAVAKEFNVSNEIIKEVLSSFYGVEHRMEFVKKLNNREFYNDSKSTNVKSTQVALSSFKTPVILILGGLDRKLSFDDLKDYMNFVKCVVCYGETKYQIEAFCKKINKDVIVVETLEEATKASYNISDENDIILLSPACASWDQFSSFEERGEYFKKVVENL